MKRFLTLLFTCALLCAALCVTAGASDYDSVAQELAGIGMFRGTASGFELDRAPKRSEAAIMLVRLYGAEEEANAQYAAGEITHPFTDVSDFTAPYVAWLYTKGITNGTSATTFSSQNPCTKQNYLVFLLRALGYQDGADFTYADAEEFAESCGFYEPSYFEGEFLRDDLAALTEQALAADVKGGGQTLLAALIADGAIDAAAAKPLSDKIDAYRVLSEASAAAANQSAMDIDLGVESRVSAEGESMLTRMNYQIKVITGGKTPRVAMTVETLTDEASSKISLWYKDGWAYYEIESESGTLRYKTEGELTDEEALELVNNPGAEMSEIAMVRSLSAEKSGSDTVYTAVYGMTGLNSMLSELLGELVEDDEGELRIADVTTDYTLNAKGELKALDMLLPLVIHLPLESEEGSSIVDVTGIFNFTETINAVGSDVKITYPDFRDFQEAQVIMLPGDQS